MKSNYMKETSSDNEGASWLWLAGDYAVAKNRQVAMSSGQPMSTTICQQVD